MKNDLYALLNSRGIDMLFAQELAEGHPSVSESLMDGLRRFSSLPMKTYLLLLLGFGFFFSWIWLGLYEGYPYFYEGKPFSEAVIALMTGFAGAVLLVGFNSKVRSAMPSGGVLISGIIATLSSLATVVLRSDSIQLDDQVCRYLVDGLSGLIGLGTGGLLLGFGTRFSRLDPKEAMFAFCASFIVAFFAFFAVDSLDHPFSEAVFSLFPAVAAVCLWRRVAPVPLKKADDLHNNRTAEVSDTSTNHPKKYARGFVQMVVAFAVYVFAASLAQSFEPQKDFALGVDEAWVGFFLICAVTVWFLMTDERVGTFKLLKILYQAAIVLMVIKLTLQPLLTDDSAFAALNVMTYLTLFFVFWQLTAFVGYVGEVDPGKAYALVFGLAGIAMGAAWLLGVYFHGYFGRERLYLSIAVGCAIAVFCSFGFSVRSFPYLTNSGKGRMKMQENVKTASTEASQEFTLPALDDVIGDLVQEFSLTPREAEIFGMLADGKTSEEISEELVISYHTVRTHIRNLYVKLGATTRSELLLLVSERERAMGGKSKDELCRAVTLCARRDKELAHHMSKSAKGSHRKSAKGSHQMTSFQKKYVKICQRDASSGII